MGTASGAGVVFYGSGFDGQGVVVSPDMNGNGFPEIGVMGRHAVKGWVRVQYRDVNAGTFILQDFFNPGWAPHGVKTVADMNGNGYPELALASTDPYASNGIQIQVHDSYTNAPLAVVYYGSSDTLIGFDVLPDTNANLEPELAVLGVNKTNGNVRVQVKDALSGGLVRNVFFNRAYAPTSLVVPGDVNANGLVDLGVLGSNVVNGSSQVQMKDVLGLQLLNVPLP